MRPDIILLLLVPVIGLLCGLDSSVGIATELRPGRSGIEFQWGRDFPLVQTSSWAHPASCTMGTGSFLGVKAAWAWSWPSSSAEGPRKE